MTSGKGCDAYPVVVSTDKHGRRQCCRSLTSYPGKRGTGSRRAAYSGPQRATAQLILTAVSGLALPGTGSHLPWVMSEPKRRVLLASPRGYCAGVDRAVQSVELALERFGAPVYVRKQIVHNTHVVRALEQRGAIFVEETEEVPEGSVVVFSAHGIAPQVRDDAAARGLHTIDATCPLVTKVHNEARRFAAQDYDILLIGHEGHEEVVGTTGEAPTRIHLVDGPEGSTQVQVRDPAKVAWLSQTTLSVDETNETVTALRERFPLLIDPPSDDICYATQNRQTAVKQIAAEADVVIVVGSRNSSNSVRLVEVATDAGAKAAYLVERRRTRGARPTACRRWA